MAFYHRKEEEKVPGLFDAVAPMKPAPALAESRKPYPRHIMLKHESEVFGFVLSAHPIALYAHRLKHLRYVRARDLSARVGKHVTVIGWPVTGKTVHSRDGKPMKFMTFEDLTGTYEAVFFPDIYDRFCSILNVKRPYILGGKVEESFSAINLTVERVKVLNLTPPSLT